jgi:lipopolysaccharide/colanic/teichoic acid biosynthesis glycosyltransferase
MDPIRVKSELNAETGNRSVDRANGVRHLENGTAVNEQLAEVAVTPVAATREAGQALGSFAVALKRAFDLVGALILIILLSPLWVLIAILIKADSPGPTFFRQRRIGRNGEPFRMLKFRTMVKGADAQKPALLHMNQAAEGLFKISEDPRVTRIGHWLRITSLDELPQLLHVLTGRMSLVGPRPLVPEEDGRITGKQRERRAVRPGITGIWQVRGASAIPLHEMVQLDREYVENWSLWLDLKLLFATTAHVVGRRGM